MQYDLVMPMAWLAFLTLDVITWTELQRGFGIMKGRVKLEDFRYGDSKDVPPEMVVSHRNYMNLLESPVLFYVACLLALQINAVDVWFWRLAWIYVLLRTAHSIIHIWNKHFPARIVFFATSLFVLALIWGKLSLGL